MNKLHLTPAEQSLFEALPEALREGWEVASETLTYTDNPQKQVVRLSLLRLHDPTLKAFREKVMQCEGMEQIVSLIQNTDLSDVQEEDIAQLFFALGPEVLSRMITAMLSQASADKHIETIAGFASIRHSILSSFASVSR